MRFINFLAVIFMSLPVFGTSDVASCLDFMSHLPTLKYPVEGRPNEFLEHKMPNSEFTYKKTKYVAFMGRPYETLVSDATGSRLVLCNNTYINNAKDCADPKKDKKYKETDEAKIKHYLKRSLLDYVDDMGLEPTSESGEKARAAIAKNKDFFQKLQKSHCSQYLAGEKNSIKYFCDIRANDANFDFWRIYRRTAYEEEMKKDSSLSQEQAQKKVTDFADDQLRLRKEYCQKQFNGQPDLGGEDSGAIQQ